MGVSAVTANAVHGDIHHIRIGHHPARDVTDLTRGQSGQGVQREVVIGRAETFEQTVGEHGPGAGAALLGRLHNHHQATAPLALSLLQRQRRGHDHGHMHVVAAGVHHRYLATVEFRGPHLAGVRQTGLLGHGQGVHIRAQQHARPLAIVQNRHQTVAAQPGGHAKTRLAQRRRQGRGRLFLLERKFGMAMQGFVEGQFVKSRRARRQRE